MCVLIEHYKRIDDLDLENRFKRLLQDDEFDEYTKINTTDTKTVINRIKKVEEYLLG